MPAMLVHHIHAGPYIVVENPKNDGIHSETFNVIKGSGRINKKKYVPTFWRNDVSNRIVMTFLNAILIIVNA